MKPSDKNFRNQILTFMLAAVMLTGAFWGAENGVTSAPPYAWVSDIPALTMQESLQQEANTREPLAEENRTQDETKAETPQDAQGDKQAEDNKNAASEEEPNEEEDTDTGDLKEDAYAKETFSEDALLEEIGLADGKITEIKVITGAGQEETVKNKNGAFDINLSTKNATILQVSYLDGNGNHKVYTKRVKYERPEGSTPAEKMPKIETNLKDGGTYNQQELNFDVWLTDYRGRRLSYSNMEVTANGDAADYIGEMDRQTYSVKLKEGANEIRVLARDVYQYAIVKTWTVYYKAGKGEITISLEGGTVGIPYFIRPQKMEVSDGENLAQVVERFLTQNGYSYRHAGTIKEGFYLSAVKKKGMLAGFSIPKDLIQKIEEDNFIFDIEGYAGEDELGEFDFSQGSGWMYSINGIYSSYGLSKAHAQDGDIVRIRFTLAYGKDIGGYKAMGETYGQAKDYGKEW